LLQHGARTLYPYDDNGVTGYDRGAIQAWAWGFSRAIDYLMTLSYVDHNHIDVAGIRAAPTRRSGLELTTAASSLCPGDLVAVGSGVA
jgi:hypothetical protein